MNESTALGETIEHRYAFDSELARRLFGDPEKVLAVARAGSAIADLSLVARALCAVEP
jgi:hypothetical protein